MSKGANSPPTQINQKLRKLRGLPRLITSSPSPAPKSYESEIRIILIKTRGLRRSPPRRPSNCSFNFCPLAYKARRETSSAVKCFTIRPKVLRFLRKPQDSSRGMDLGTLNCRRFNRRLQFGFSWPKRAHFVPSAGSHLGASLFALIAGGRDFCPDGAV